jgi:LmbE family N-acetylglucosaminyl deacetylase
VIAFGPGQLTEIVVVGAHCDDIAIGMGGTLLTLARQHPGLVVRGLVLSGGGTARADEERAALAAFCPGAVVDVTIGEIPDGRAPAHWSAIKELLATLSRSATPDLVFGPQPRDAHQDHRLLAELLPTEFRNHVILGYEILKWETDTPRPNVFHPLADGVAEEKSQLLHDHYPSQVSRGWFDEQAFVGLARMRGVQCNAPHAEAFCVDKLTVAFGSPANPTNER